MNRGFPNEINTSYKESEPGRGRIVLTQNSCFY